MDYRKFLAQEEERVLPWTGGASVVAKGRRLRLSEAPAARGWWRFRIQGRKATPLEAAEVPELEDLPRVRGHVLASDRLVTDGAWVEPLVLPPDDEPELFAPLSARRWHSGELLYGQLEFEEEAEEQVRQALETGAALAGIKGVSSTLRAAYGYLLAERTAARLQVPLLPLEIRGQVAAIANGGAPAAEAAVRRLQAQRDEALRQQRGPWGQLTTVRAWTPEQVSDDRFESRVERVLANAGAELLRTRRSGGENREVVYRFLGQRFASIVHHRTLNVLDAGICLSGADRELTLESLPGVIREAIETDVLYVTRRVGMDD